MTSLILASGSSIRRQLLENAGLTVEVHKPLVDEDSIKQSLLAEDAKARDVADALAEYKARKIAHKFPDRLVLGCDQVLSFGLDILSKPTSEDHAFRQLHQMSGSHHELFSAAVIYEAGKPVWRSVAKAKLHMRNTGQDYLKSYVSRNWEDIRHCVGAYQLEAEGVRLFQRIEGDYFTVLGMPLLGILSYLTTRGIIEG